MKATPEDRRWMEHALALAANGLYTTGLLYTNPSPRDS